MKCPRNHEMVLLLRTYVCDLCDVERRRSQAYNPTPSDEGYEPVQKLTQVESGDHAWAWKQLEVGKAVVYITCNHSTQACLGWGYRIRSGYVEHRKPNNSVWIRESRVTGQSDLQSDHKYALIS